MFKYSSISFRGYEVERNNESVSLKHLGDYIIEKASFSFNAIDYHITFPRDAEGMGLIEDRDSLGEYGDAMLYTRDFKAILRIYKSTPSIIVAYAEIAEYLKLKDPPAVMKLLCPRTIESYLVFQSGPTAPELSKAFGYYSQVFAKLEPRSEPPEGLTYPPPSLELKDEYSQGAWVNPVLAKSLNVIGSNTPVHLILGKMGGRFFALIPLSSENYKCYIRGGEGYIVLKPRSFMKINRGGFVPFGIVGVGEDPYKLIRLLYECARSLTGLPVGFRWEKNFPEIFKKLGWCSWNAFLREINEERVLDTVKKMREKGVPIQYVLIDDGWQSVRNDRLTDFEANAERFPRGIRNATKKLKEIGVNWVGVWHTLQGYWRGVDPSSEKFKQYRFVKSFREEKYVPHVYEAFKFFENFFGFLRKSGVDFVKVDNQCGLQEYFINFEMPLMEASSMYIGSLEEAAKRSGLVVLDCMCHVPEAYLNWKYSSVARASNDYVPNWIDGAKLHVYSSGLNSLWLSVFAWPDYDMFVSGDKASRVHSVLRAISGGPIYMTDRAETVNPEIVRKLCLSDGELLRVDEPALPSPDTLFKDPLNGDSVFKLFSTVEVKNFGVIGVLAVFNISIENKTLNFTVSPNDIPSLNQDENYFVYEHFSGKAWLIPKGGTISGALTPLEAKLFIFSPVKGSVALVGLADKYISPAGIEGVYVKGPNVVEVEAKERGLVKVYVKGTVKKVIADGVSINVRDCTEKVDEGYLIVCSAKKLVIEYC